MAQSQVSDDGKYVRSGHALTWTWIAFTVAALAAALAIGIFRIGAYQSAIDAVRSTVNGSARRSPVTALQEEAPMLIREGARISVPDGSPLRGKLTVGPVAQREIQRKLVLPAVVEADPARTVKVLPPVTGRVTDLMVQLGERVVQGQDLSVIDLQVARGAFLNDATAAIMTIANLGTVWVTANVPEKDTALVTTGQDVDVVFYAYPGEVFAGKVLFISDVLDPDTRRTKIRIAFDNPAMKLKANMV